MFEIFFNTSHTRMERQRSYKKEKTPILEKTVASSLNLFVEVSPTIINHKIALHNSIEHMNFSNARDDLHIKAILQKHSTNQMLSKIPLNKKKKSTSIRSSYNIRKNFHPFSVTFAKIPPTWPPITKPKLH